MPIHRVLASRPLSQISPLNGTSRFRWCLVELAGEGGLTLGGQERMKMRAEASVPSGMSPAFR